MELGYKNKLCWTLSGVFFLSTGFAADNNPTKQQEAKASATTSSTSKKSSSATNTILYVPPFRGAPRNRVGGGTRGAGHFQLAAITPRHTGHTINSQPRLHFLQTTPKGQLLEFTLVARDAEEPLVETQIESNGEVLQSIDLKTLNISLEPEKEYQWYISIIVDSKKRAKDVVSGGGIRYISAPQELTQKLAQDIDNKAVIMAQSGVWYDALDAVLHLHNPDQQLARLLDQVGLSMDNFAH